MLQLRELATIRAALQYWREEICPHGLEAAKPYWDEDGWTPLGAKEVERLRNRFLPTQLRIATVAKTGEELASCKLFQNIEEVRQSGDSTSLISTVLMPARSKGRPSGRRA